MSKKLYISLLLVTIACLAGAFTVVTLNQKHEKQTEVSAEMPRFPSYDWDAIDDHYLASVAANTPGTGRQKQEAIINALSCVWAEPNVYTIQTWVERHYELYNEPTDYDRNLVWMVIQGEWATD